MRFRACIALLLFVAACATSAPSPREPATRDPRLAKLQRAATLPWTDGGRCVVQEVSQPWPVLVERCFHALDHDRIEFHDPTGRCAVASAGAAAAGIGVCVLAAPEIAVGAVIVTGVVVVGFAIKEALDAYELGRARPEERPAPEPQPEPETTPAPQESSPKQRPKPEPKGPDFPPLGPIETLERERRPECKPIPVPHLGGNRLHNKCADRVPNNDFSGWDAFVNGKNFDALQMRTRTLWEVKTTAIETYNPFVQQMELTKQVEEGLRERELAAACGYDFVIGVRTKAHKKLLEEAEPRLTIVLMKWCK
ncbi:hypothetical protein F0U62_14750 [Cystobacter fuscus]|uniref:DUF6310 domain-containing protein n=1 Tax=Cystobacter fuscus TaxID=43 RepID=UPI002B3243D9|nr:hypothetical protein F0U62_14750 [Cystobacter fuscus]